MGQCIRFLRIHLNPQAHEPDSCWFHIDHSRYDGGLGHARPTRSHDSARAFVLQHQAKHRKLFRNVFQNNPRASLESSFRIVVPFQVGDVEAQSAAQLQVRPRAAPSVATTLSRMSDGKGQDPRAGSVQELCCRCLRAPLAKDWGDEAMRSV